MRHLEDSATGRKYVLGLEALAEASRPLKTRPTIYTRRLEHRRTR